MIQVEIWTADGDSYDVGEIAPSEVDSFVEVIKKHGTWIDNKLHSFVEAVYHPQKKIFEITVE